MAHGKLTRNAEIVGICKVFSAKSGPLFGNTGYVLISVDIGHFEFDIITTPTPYVWPIDAENFTATFVTNNKTWVATKETTLDSSNILANRGFDMKFWITTIGTSITTTSSTAHEWANDSNHLLLAVVNNVHRKTTAIGTKCSPKKSVFILRRMRGGGGAWL